MTKRKFGSAEGQVKMSSDFDATTLAGDDLTKAADKSIELILRYGGTGEDHHRQWILDQVLRLLLGDNYAIAIQAYNDMNKFHAPWWEGIAP